MKISTYSSLFLLTSCLCSAQAMAASSYASSAALTFNVNSITNLTDSNSHNLAGFSMTGSFQKLTDYAVSVGDGHDSASPGNSLVTVSGNSFSKTFLAQGSVLNGSLASSYTGKTALNFINTSSNSFSVDVNLNYNLHSLASDINADSTIYLDYGVSDNSFTGFSFLQAATIPDFLTIDDQTLSGNSGHVILNIAGNSTLSFFANAAIVSNLESTTVITSVPEPSLVWYFFTGLLGFSGIMRRRSAVCLFH